MYTGQRGEAEFEQDFISELQKAGWGEVIRNPTVDDLIENWRRIIFQRNRAVLHDYPLSDGEMRELLEEIGRLRTPEKVARFLQVPPGNSKYNVTIHRDADSPDVAYRGKEVYLDLFTVNEIGGGTSVYQIAEQVKLKSSKKYADNRGDVTLLINGLPLIHIELKASDVPVMEACTQIKNYMLEGDFSGFMSFVQVFWAITPEDALYFANPGEGDKFNPKFFFHWGDADNNLIYDWHELIRGKSHILSIPEAHKLIGYYTIPTKSELLVCRYYQFEAIKAIVDRTARQKWGDHNQRGGYCYAATGSGKTASSFKAGQLIIDMGYADKVVFAVDRSALDDQSAGEYQSFMRDGESIRRAGSTRDLFRALRSDSTSDAMIITTMQKLSRINEDSDQYGNKLDKVNGKRVVFIVDEAHRSQFGKMHQKVKKAFPCSLMFGFTGTPIFPDNMHEGEMTTEAVFGECLSSYSLAYGIRDGNILPFQPFYIRTFDYKAVRERMADKAKNGGNGPYSDCDVESYLDSQGDYDTDKHREKVVEDIRDKFSTFALDKNGNHRFHGILATSSIPEACAYWELFQKEDRISATAVFDTNSDPQKESTADKNRYISQILEAYNERYKTVFTPADIGDYRNDVILRLSHKGPYAYLGEENVLDIVIVVNQLLTGFDSRYVNIVYFDKVMQGSSLIQAISRTNRVLGDSKPFGSLRFYREPETMKENLDDALEIYCGGAAVAIAPDLDETIAMLNDRFETIRAIFAHDEIKNFSRLPESEADRRKFSKEFRSMKKEMRGAVLKGLKWSDGKLIFTQDDYRRLDQRLKDMNTGRTRTGETETEGGYNDEDLFDSVLSETEGERIDYEYLEKRFRVLTMSEIQAEREKAADEIIGNLGDMPENQQYYAQQVVNDAKNGKLKADDKGFHEYISDYEDAAIHKAIEKEADKYGIDANMFYDVYMSAKNGENVDLKLTELKKTADTEKCMEYFECKKFNIPGRLDGVLREFIAKKKADACPKSKKPFTFFDRLFEKRKENESTQKD